MVRYLKRKNENSEKHESVEEPSGDGLPARSSAPRTDPAAENVLVADDTEAYEDPQTGVRLSYSLKEREIYECLRTAGYRISGNINGAATICLLTVLIAAVLSLSVSQGRSFFVLLMFLCAAAAAAVFFYVKRTARAFARSAADGSVYKLEIFPDCVRVEYKNRRTEIPLDGTCEYSFTRSTLALFCPTGNAKRPKILILPLRCVDPKILPDVEAVIRAGAKPKEQKA